MDQQQLWDTAEAVEQISSGLSIEEGVKQARLQNEISALDYQFSEFIKRKGGDEQLQLAALLVSDALSHGHSCLPLDQPLTHYRESLVALHSLLDPDQLCSQLQHSSKGLLGDGSEVTAMVLCDNNLYLYRYWRYEQQVAARLLHKVLPSSPEPEWLKQALDRLFPVTENGIDWQRVAAAVALNNSVAVISGGPGTGKTTTVVRMLALWLEHRLQQSPVTSPLIRLAAPTGKAAARLAESIAGARDKLDIDAQVTELIPDTASTLHRLLGALPKSRSFRHHKDNPLHLDLLVVDEASMVDLPMMAKLLAALPTDAQLVLIGDRDQLASVEAGAVLGDICAGKQPRYGDSQQQLLQRSCGYQNSEQSSAGSIADSLALLHKSYRFHEHSGIGHLARAVNAGQVKQSAAVFKQGYEDIALFKLDEAHYRQLITEVCNSYQHYLECIEQQGPIEDVLSAFTRCQLLCALREGPFGVQGLNDAVEAALQHRRLIRADGSWYSGRPVMISRNDSALGLYNGDIGIAIPDAEGKLRVWFEQQGQVRSVLPSRLPEHDTVYAMTVHKSQGSEFDKVLMVLPEQESAVLTRELLYTGITRAKKECHLYGRWPVISKAIVQQTVRSGGLKQLLWS